MIDRKTPVPLYFQLAETVRAQIAAGELASGDRLPSEHDLCRRYQVSRSVVRQALQSLSQDGLIAAEQGRGTFVRDRKVPITFTQRLASLQEDMARAGFRLTTRVLRQTLVAAPRYVVDQIGDERAVLLERVRFADGQVTHLVRSYLPFARVPGLLEYRGLEVTSLYDLLKETLGLVATTGRRTIEIAPCPAEIAEHLEIGAETQALFSRTTTFDQHGRAFEYYEAWHHPDRTRLTIDVYHDTGAPPARAP